MKGLVSYDSSSSDEGDDEVRTGQPEKVGVSEQVSLIGKSSSSRMPDYTAPNSTVGYVGTANQQGDTLIGPMAPDGVVDSYEESSEQDLIRYLTQATHPLTSIPESPPGSPDAAADARIQRFLELKARGVHFNGDLASKTTFRNPSLLSIMIKRAEVDGAEQYITSLPAVLWDPSCLPEWAFKEALLKSQQDLREKDEAAKKILSAAGKRSIEFASASNSAG